jgi:hypothetical protein
LGGYRGYKSCRNARSSKGPTTNKIKQKNGDILESILDGQDYIIKKVIEDMAMLESENGKRQILTEVDTLRLFYRKKKEVNA